MLERLLEDGKLDGDDEFEDAEDLALHLDTKRREAGGGDLVAEQETRAVQRRKTLQKRISALEAKEEASAEQQAGESPRSIHISNHGHSPGGPITRQPVGLQHPHVPRLPCTSLQP